MQVFRETVLQIEQPIIVAGIDCSVQGHCVKATDKGKVNPEWFLTKTLIIGYDTANSTGPGAAEWELKIPKSISKSIFQANLIVQAFRYHAGVHSPNRHSEASVHINDNEIKIYMDAPMPYGLDYGFDRVISLRVESFIKGGTKLNVKLAVSQGVFWDVDELRLEIITRKHKMRSWVGFAIGLIVGTVWDFLFHNLLGLSLLIQSTT